MYLSPNTDKIRQNRGLNTACQVYVKKYYPLQQIACSVSNELLQHVGKGLILCRESLTWYMSHQRHTAENE